MSRFVLTAQLQLQAPTNVGQVVQQIQSQLNNVRVNVQVQGATRTRRQLNQVTNATNQATSAANALGRSFGLSIKRFAAFSIATRAVSLFTSTLSSAVKEAIAFERELIKISQVTGKSISQLRDLTNEITRLSTSLGVGSTSLLSVSRILSQAGLNADETRIALDALAKSELAPTFDDIQQTAEGVVAVFNQFQQGAAALEAQLGSINAVAGRFAVEAGDLISVVRRTGGVFRAAGGDLNELIALFTSVRATTRESAESIATGLRTIFTRIQRPQTIEFLRQYGVELLDLEGKFVGPFEATRRLSEALAGLEQGDITFIKIAEELGGFRQIGKVIPLLQQFSVAQEALNVAQKGSGSLAEDAAKAQASLAVRITKVKEEFLGLVRSISESRSFQLFANTALNLASALIKLADALKPIIPLLTAFAAIKLATGFGGFLGGIRSGLRTPRAFASGGLVPGSGNRDTVPAMLTPGEFVIRKSSVAKLGAANLAAMNENRYARGTPLKGVPKPKPKSAVQKGKQVGGVGIFDSDKIPGGTNVKKALLEQLRASKKPYQVISGPAGSGKTTFAAGRFGGNFILSPADLQKYSRFVVLSGAGKTKSGDFSDDVKGLLSGASDITVLNPGTDRLMKQRQGRVDDAMSGNLPDQRSAGALQGTMRAPTDSNLDLFRGYGNVNVLDRYAGGGIITKPGAVGGFFLQPERGQDRDFKLQFSGPITNTKILGKLNKFGNSFTPTGKPTKQAEQVFHAMTAAQQARILGIAKPAKLSKNVKLDKIFSNENTPKRPLGLNGQQVIPSEAKNRFERALKRGAIGSGFGTLKLDKKNAVSVPITADVKSYFPGGDDLVKNSNVSRVVERETEEGLYKAVKNAIPDVQKLYKSAESVINPTESSIEKAAKRISKDANASSTTQGFIFEGLIQAITGARLAGNQSNFDFPYGSINTKRAALKAMFTDSSGEGIDNLYKADAKRSNSDSARKSIQKKILNDINNRGITQDLMIKKFASGGSVGTDTVPALLTPGEFVINRSSAQKIGYGSLNRMNKVGKYAKGGVVQKFARGTGGTGVSSSGSMTNMFGGLGSSITLVTASLQAMLPPIDENSTVMAKMTNKLLSMLTVVGSVIFALQAFGVSLSLQSAKTFFGRGKGSVGDLFGGYQKGGRRAGTGFREGFDLVGARSRRAAALRRRRAAVGDDIGLRSNIRAGNNRSRLARPGAVTGRSGAFLGRVAARGGILGKAAGSLAKIFGSFGSVLGPLIAPLASLAGPLLLIAGAGALIGGVIKGFRDLEGRLNDAIKAEDAATAQSLAVSKALEDSAGGLIAGLVSFGGPGLEESFLGFFSLFGGPSVASVKANINAQIESAKAQKSLKETTEKAADAMKEFEAGNISAAEAVRAAAASSAQVYQSRLATERANRENSAQRSEGVFAVARNVFTLGGFLGETSGTRNRRIEQENQQRTDQQKKLEEEQLKAAQPAINALGRQIAATGGGIEEFRAQLKALGFDDDFIRRNEKVLTDSFNNIAKEIERTKKAFDAMNLGFQSVSAVAGALTVSMDNYLASQEAGYIGLNNTIAMLEASVTSAAQGISDADFNAALGNASDGLRKLGASNADIQKFEENLGAINTAQKFFAKASEETRAALKAELERGGSGTGGLTRSKFAEILVGQLDGVPEDVRKRIQDALENADIAPDDMNKLLAGDLSVLDKVLKDLGDTTLNQVIGPLKELAKYEQQLVNLAKKRYDAENKVVEAAKNLVEAQMEAAEIIAKYGGAAFTPEMRAQGVLAQANIEGQAAGVTPLVTGSAAEFNARSAQIRQGLAGIGGIQAGAAGNNAFAQQQLEGRSGAALAEQQKRLLNLAKTEYETAKKLIGIKEQELKLIAEKNRLEKSSIEALVTGDITKFFEQQAAVGATASIALGSTRLQSAYGADALGLAAQDIKRQQEAGVTEIYGQQVSGSGGLAERAFGAALSARGVSQGTALGMAQTAAGTTSEEEALRGEIISLATTLPNYAATQLQVAEQDLQVANIQMMAAEMQLEAAKRQVQQRGQVPPRAPGAPPAPPAPQNENPLADLDFSVNSMGAATGIALGGLAGAALGSFFGIPLLGALAGSAIGGGIGASFNKGGVVYANNGMFVPRGTDTVPAMLTPGEFVVRRAAVQRGNNLAILKAMNKGQSGVSTSGALSMANGGVVYADRGGLFRRRAGGNQPVQSSGSIGINPETVNKLSETLTQFNSSFGSFTTALSTFNSTLSANIDRLNNTTFNVKLDTTNVNVNLNGGSFLAKLRDDIRDEVLTEVAQQISTYTVGQDGRLKKNSGTLTT